MERYICLYHWTRLFWYTLPRRRGYEPCRDAGAQSEYEQDDIQSEVLKILEPGNEFLQELVDDFCKTRALAKSVPAACFYELKLSNVGRIVGRLDRMVGDCVTGRRVGD